MIKKKLTAEEKMRKKVERFKTQNINPYPLKKINEKTALRSSRHLIKSRLGSDPSRPEKMIAEYLSSVGIKFTREKFFKDLFSPITGKLLFFDFYLPEFRAMIEYDGQYHFQGKNLEYQRFNDALKNRFCSQRGSPLLRIKYTEQSEIYSLLENFIRTVETLKL